MTRAATALERLGRALAAGNRRVWLVAGSALVAFYTLTAASNLAETDDVYEFAFRAESLPLDNVSDPRLMLYHMLMRGLYLAAHALAPETRALWLMRGFSAVCAALLLLLVVRVLVKRFAVAPAPAVLTAAMLGSSYGLWRYAAEAEVYAAAMLLTLIVFAALLRAQSPARDGLLAGALAGLAVLFYQPNLIPVLMAFPLLLVLRRQFNTLAGYLMAAIAIVVTGYLAGFWLYWPEPLSIASARDFLSQRASEFAVVPLSIRTIVASVVRSTFAFGHDVLAATWLFGFEPIVDLIRRTFSDNVIHEEIYAAARAGWVRYAPLLILPALIVVSFMLLARTTVDGWRDALRRFRRCPPVTVTALWLALQAAVIGRLNPAGIEAWIVVLLPAGLLLGCIALPLFESAGQRRLVVAVATLLFAHNLTGGMALTWDPALELDRVRGEWVLQHARDGDLVVVSDNIGFAELLRYRTPADVALIRSTHAPRLAMSINSGIRQFPVPDHHRQHARRNTSELVGRTLAAGGRVILFDGFFHEDPLPVSTQEPFFTHEQRELDLFRSRLHIVRRHPVVGATYVYRAAER